MRELSELTSAVVGTGFVGVVHVDALRRLGVSVKGVVGSTAERARAKAGLPEPYESFTAMLADPEVDVVHLATPNHLHYPQVKAVLAAGKHVVCEKPLAMAPDQSAELVELAGASGLVHCTNFNLRFYPQVQEARARVAAGSLGDVWNVHGSYLQDWLLLPTDWNWRLDSEQGGELRAIADIGSHWFDLTQFATGRRIEAVLADLATTIPVRRRPSDSVETFTQHVDVGGVDVPIRSEDLGNVLVRYEGGAHGAVVVSQVAAGRRNRLAFEVNGSSGSLAWTSERNEELWLGHRDRPNELLWRDPTLMEGPVRGVVPAGHHEGYQDTFRELYAAVYRAIVEGTTSQEPSFPTFEDGHRANVLAAAVATSHRDRRWVEIAI